jgi:hypothetical protein
MFIGRKFVMALLALAALSLGVRAQNPTKGKSAAHDAAVVQDFEARVGKYLQQRQDKAGSLPGPTTSASKLQNTRDGMRARIEANRAGAKQGDIFTPAIAAYLHRQIAGTFHSKRGPGVAASLQHAEPGKITLHVNQPYPDGVALQSMPPTLLQKLPKLPQELQYRIVGRNLVLLDTEPNLVVDILANAIPTT